MKDNLELVKLVVEDNNVDATSLFEELLSERIKIKLEERVKVVGRSFLVPEESLDEEYKDNRGAFRNSASSDRQVNVRNFGFHVSRTDKQNSEAIAAAKRALGARGGKVVGVPDSHKHLMGEEVEVETLDELSKKTLGSYVKKAVADNNDRHYEAGHKVGRGDRRDVSFGKRRKREDMVNVAVNKLTKEEVEVETLDEAMRLLKTHTSESGKKSAKVYRNPYDNEYVVKHFVNGKHQKDADYFTDHEDDAHDTAKVHAKD